MNDAPQDILDSELEQALTKVEAKDTYRLPYRFGTEHSIMNKTQLVNKLVDLRLAVAQAASLIALVNEEF